jgi:hypothetical protein
MALQSSGAISINDVKTELGSASTSLRTLSSLAGKSAPDAMSEFYGYSAVTWFETPVSVPSYEDAAESCNGQFEETRTLYYIIFSEKLYTEPDGEVFNGQNLWYYFPNFAGSFIVNEVGQVGEFYDGCK